MNGPCVNMTFYTELEKTWEEAQLPNLIDIGTCSVHVIHGAFKTGIESTNREIKGSFKLLHDLSACRADYSVVTGLDIFPLYFWSMR